MTSAPQREPGRRSHRPRHCPPSAPARTGLGRHRAPSPAHAAGRRGAARPAALWLCGDAEPLPGTALLAAWLGRTILTLVTTYTRPGDRVLLLTPPPSPRQSPQRPGRAPGGDPYAGLAEAVWTITRLGRSTDTATAAPAPDHLHDRTDSVGHTGAQSGSRPRPDRLRLHTPTDPNPDSAHHPDRTASRPGRGFDLVITTVDPHATDWLARTDWDTILTPPGLAAVITHSETRAGRLLDPQPAITDTFRHRGLRCLDHIAVLDTAPPPRPTIAADAAPRNTLAPAHGRPPRESAAAVWPVRRVHHDLVLFGRLAVPLSRSTPSNRGETSDV
ncbi:hypothetical protein [Amycolatopsis sp. NPDC058986]|uniref:hypothetical protein n=1 Tax=unclassified Amycolatopsis TaxID=2618356 RepID=UPI00366ED410